MLTAYAGTHLINQAEPAQVSRPMVTAAAASGATALTALISSGPAAAPESLHSRQPPMNWARSATGAASAPSVITTPAEIPLPRPIRAATRPTPSGLSVSVSSRNPSPSTSMAGTATNTRPNRSMIAPPG